MHQRISIALLLSFCAASILSGCSMQEEMRRIEEVKKMRAFAAASRTTNLSGEQIFIRSCNTCHISGEDGPQAPSLIDMDKHFPDDNALKSFLRKGKGTMPPLPVSGINEEEMDSLVAYLRQLNVDLHELEVEREEARKRRELRKQKLKEQKELEQQQKREARRRARNAGH